MCGALIGPRTCAQERIRKILQQDDDVGRISQATPFVISKAVEYFLDDLVRRAIAVAREHDVSTIGAGHVKEFIVAERMFDFLLPLVQDVPDIDREKEIKAKQKRAKRKRRPALAAGDSSAADEESSSAADRHVKRLKTESDAPVVDLIPLRPLAAASEPALPAPAAAPAVVGVMELVVPHDHAIPAGLRNLVAPTPAQEDEENFDA